MDLLWQEVERKQNMKKDDTKIQNTNVLGYENVAFPFLALLTGLFAALLQLGIEFVVFCKRKYADIPNQSSDESSTPRESRLIIKEFGDMLQENNSNTDIKLQSAMRDAREIMEKINQLLQETYSK